MSESHDLTEAKEDYIRAIFVLRHRHNKAPMLNEIADYLQVKKTTATEALKTLNDQGYVIKEKYKAIDLTSKGLVVAKNLTFKHRLIEAFLHRFLDVGIDQVHDEAHKLEHALSDEVVNKLFSFLTNPDHSIALFEKFKSSNQPLTCPHGQPLRLE